MTRDAVRRALRTFVIATLALFIPGLLGWLNAMTRWANDEGSTPFPDATGLAYLGVSAIVAGVIAVINLVWNLVEDAAGKGLLREVPPRNPSA
jgi:TRAP-type C4-dicarboxylate transport system permease small subunit